MGLWDASNVLFFDLGNYYTGDVFLLSTFLNVF